MRKDIVKPSDNNRVLIIGNGFDLDLGWNTRFSDFARSGFWPHNIHTGSIISYLEKVRDRNDWFDIEAEIGNYASGGVTRGNSLRTIKINHDYFEKLREGFKAYISLETQKEINSDCLAAKVLKEVLSNQNFSSIYSFNYTNLHQIAGMLGLTGKFEYEHVHGSLQDDSIIIGAPEDNELNSGYEFLYKTFSAYYRSNNLIYDLRDAKEVVFFGHSLGPTDYHYFQSFFRDQCREGMDRSAAKKITIFTYNDESRISIMKQLRAMNDKKTNLLINQNDFKIIMTAYGNTQEIDDFVLHLRNTSQAVCDMLIGSAI